MQDKENRKHVIFILIFDIIWNIFLFTQKPLYMLSPDSSTYQIGDLSQLFDGHRLPLYRFINWLFFKLFGNNYDYASIAVVLFQTIISILVIILVYDGLSIVLKSHKLILFLTLLYGIIVSAFGYNEHILTESLAVSLMTFLIWLIVKCINEEKVIYFIVLPIMALIAVLLRPSFIFFFPLYGLFLILYTVKHKKQGIYGLISMAFAVICILGVCTINKDKCGVFCLSCVSYQNELGILVSTNSFDSVNYPQISEYVKNEIVNSESEDKCNYFTIVSERFGPSTTLSYMKDCKQKYFFTRVRYIIEKVLYPYSDSFIVKTDSKMNLKMQMLFCAIRVCIFPFTYGTLFFISFIFLIDSIIRSIRKKRMLYTEMGVVGCIWCIYILTFLTLYEASAQRIAVHLIPCVVILYGLVIERVSNIVVKKDNI